MGHTCQHSVAATVRLLCLLPSVLAQLPVGAQLAQISWLQPARNKSAIATVIGTYFVDRQH
jgi:hypothetical protein